MANSHTNARARCPLCEEKIKLAHPALQEFWIDVKQEFPDVHLSWVWRGEEEQNLFLEEKKTTEAWPNSLHNSMKNGKPCARAFDVFRLGSDGKAQYPPRFFYQISEYLVRLKAPIIWGGSWKTFGDGDHYQLKKDVV